MYIYHPTDAELSVYGLYLSCLKEKGAVVVFTNGCFDLLHKGHLYSLQRCRELGTHVIVGLNTDSSVRKLKGTGRPIEGELIRRTKLLASGLVDDVITFADDTPIRLLKNIRPDVLLKGGDYTIDDICGNQYAKHVEILKRMPGFSTTEMINTSNETV